MKNYFKTLLVAALTIASSVSATAQSSNLQAELVSGEEYYLYSPGHGKYVNGDGAWKTQAIMSDTPMRIVMKDEGDGYWSIKTKDITVSGKNYTTGNKFFKRENAKGADMIFVDGGTDKPYKWKITNMGNLQYKIQAHDATGDGDACMGVRNDISNTQTNSIVYGPYFNQTYSENDCLWEFIKP